MAGVEMDEKEFSPTSYSRKDGMGRHVPMHKIAEVSANYLRDEVWGPVEQGEEEEWWEANGYDQIKPQMVGPEQEGTITYEEEIANAIKHEGRKGSGTRRRGHGCNKGTGLFQGRRSNGAGERMVDTEKGTRRIDKSKSGAVT